MNKILTPCLFQGEKQLQKNKEYFEGWYFKNTNQTETISFIPGISSYLEKKEAFIQIITHENSWYIPFPITEFHCNDKPFGIQIGNNYFSCEKIEVSIHTNQLNLEGNLQYLEKTQIEHHLLSPNIMGFFSFVPHMECNHAIISMKHSIIGKLKLNGRLLCFSKGVGYIEKDWGTSFPSQYIWGQANCFTNKNTSLVFAIATIPFQGFHFQGLICSFMLSGKEYRFATYNGAKIVKYEIHSDEVILILKKKHITLEIIAKNHKSQTLKAPKQGNMKNHIQESIQAEIQVTLRQKETIFYQDKSYSAGLEIIV